MFKYLFILNRLTKFNFRQLKSLSNVSILFSCILSTLIISLVFSISDGYKSNIVNSIISFDGYGRIYANQPLLIENIKNPNYFYESEYILKSEYENEGISFIALTNIDTLLQNIIKTDINNKKILIFTPYFLKFLLNIPLLVIQFVFDT